MMNAGRFSRLRFQRLRRAHNAVALLLLNTLIALFALNALCAMIFAAKDHWTRNPVSRQYGDRTLALAYPDLSQPEIDGLLKETWSRLGQYEPFTQFKERAFRGRYVNVSEHGFRITKNQGPWPPGAGPLNVFIFGGSTTFGYGVPDDQTLASHLQESLPTSLRREVRAYNFGRGWYFSTQERILYEQLLSAGSIPDLAIFVDGLNDFYYADGVPEGTDLLAASVEADQTSTLAWLLLARCSLARVAAGVRLRFSREYWQKEPEDEPADPRRRDAKILDRIIERYLSNKKAIEALSRIYNVDSYFVWQPVPTYGYDQRYHLFPVHAYDQDTLSGPGYERMAELLRQRPMGRDFLWCADIQRGLKEPLYVDKVHYTASFTKRFAGFIAVRLGERLQSVQRDESHALIGTRPP
jgi:hypothetical protein